MLPTLTSEDEVIKERTYILQLVGFVTGTMGYILFPITIQHPDWRLWFNEKSSYYEAGVTQLGIWKICFPPNSKDLLTVQCCHEFDLFEEFFPIEMKVAQVSMYAGSLFAYGALFLAFLIPCNMVFGKRVKSTFLPLIGGIFFYISSICVFVPITWNVYSVLINESITFRTSYHLPSKPISQKIGAAVYLGYMSGGLLFVSGLIVLFQMAQRVKLSSRVLPV